MVTACTGKASCCFIIAAVILLGIAPLSFADVIYTSAEPNGVSSFTVDGSTFQFQSQSNLVLAKCPGSDGPEDCFASESSVSAVGNSILDEGVAEDLQAGEVVGPGGEYGNEGEMLWVNDIPFDTYGIEGQWRNSPDEPNPGYLGFRVQASDGFHYGWALAEVGGWLPDPSDPTSSFYAVALDYAYESCPNQSIAAGATSGGASCDDPPDPASEPATATLLVAGLAGLELSYRRLLKSRLCIKLE